MTSELNIQKPLVIFVLGPTASGKSEFALGLATGENLPKFDNDIKDMFSEPLRLQPEIFNCDSIQTYKDLKIGSAAPTQKDLLRAPHHLFGFVKTGDQLNASEFRNIFLSTLDQRFQAGVQVVIAVGGSGFYVDSIVHGLAEIPAVPEEIRSQVQRDLHEKSISYLFAELKENDPDYALSISNRDSYRITRALEILRSGFGKPSHLFSARKKPDLNFRYVKLGVQRSRSNLSERIVHRTKEIIQSGLVDETRSLVNRGYENWRPLQSVGYKEALMYLRKEIDERELEERIVIATRQLAKKQMTWFRRDHEIKWVDLDL